MAILLFAGDSSGPVPNQSEVKSLSDSVPISIGVPGSRSLCETRWIQSNGSKRAGGHKGVIQETGTGTAVRADYLLPEEKILNPISSQLQN